ncbi:hypothetical protein [Bdellovibrio sp. HCB337]|uniref:hypothetical protein n=1 Tax=Bdellovibrio sp. HCB337 TaxID=3394358 RepID=UPI0039A4CD45
MNSNKNYFEIQRLQNLTTEFPLLKSLASSPMEAVEIDDRHVSFEAPHKTCALGQLVEVSGVLFFQNEKQKFSATGRISSFLDVGDNLGMFTVEMHRFDTNLWGDFRRAIERTQYDVDRLFRAMRDLE